jgi:hypothetical protein
MNAGTCWGKNTIDPSGRRVEKLRKATLTFPCIVNLYYIILLLVGSFYNIVQVKFGLQQVHKIQIY